MKRTNGSPKAVVMDALKKRGLTANRVTDDKGMRVWRVSDGKDYPSLAALWNAYKPKKE